jgi:uncharacterized paraquat-inducible protein A
MAKITTYYCPKCRCKISGLGWETGRMDNCPECRTYIKNLNRMHLNEFDKYIFMCVFFLILFILISIFSKSPNGMFFGCIFSIGSLIMAVILFYRRSTAK